MLTTLLLAAGVGYFCGAIPFGYLVARAKGVNIFEVGSKNPGATNVLRTLGKGPGYLTFALDAVKGALAVLWIPLSARYGCSLFTGDSAELITYAMVVGMFFSLLGHSFSCFTRFKGGKGVATAAGAFLVLMPYALLIGLAVWLLTFYSSRYVSLASILAAASLPIAAWFLKEPTPVLVLVAVVAVLVIVRHRANISRLLAGTENKFVKKSAQAKVP